MSGDDIDRALAALTPPARSDVIETWRRPDAPPVGGDEVLLMIQWRDGSRSVWRGCYYALGLSPAQYHVDGDRRGGVVVAWMPMPGPVDLLPWEAA